MKKKNKGPVRELPFIGPALKVGKDPIAFFDELYRTHGSVVPFSLLGKPFVAVFHPEDIEHVLTKNAGNYIKSQIVQ
jgi:hypothetical protein